MQPELTGKEGERREKGSKVVELRSQGTASSLTEGAAPQFNWRPPHPLFTQRESQNVRILYFKFTMAHKAFERWQKMLVSFGNALHFPTLQLVASSQFHSGAAVHPVQNRL